MFESLIAAISSLSLIPTCKSVFFFLPSLFTYKTVAVACGGFLATSVIGRSIKTFFAGEAPKQTETLQKATEILGEGRFPFFHFTSQSITGSRQLFGPLYREMEKTLSRLDKSLGLAPSGTESASDEIPPRPDDEIPAGPDFEPVPCSIDTLPPPQEDDISPPNPYDFRGLKGKEEIPSDMSPEEFEAQIVDRIKREKRIREEMRLEEEFAKSVAGPDDQPRDLHGLRSTMANVRYKYWYNEGGCNLTACLEKELKKNPLTSLVGGMGIQIGGWDWKYLAGTKEPKWGLGEDRVFPPICLVPRYLHFWWTKFDRFNMESTNPEDLADKYLHSKPLPLLKSLLPFFGIPFFCKTGLFKSLLASIQAAIAPLLGSSFSFSALLAHFPSSAPVLALAGISLSSLFYVGWNLYRVYASGDLVSKPASTAANTLVQVATGVNPRFNGGRTLGQPTSTPNSSEKGSKNSPSESQSDSNEDF